MNISVKKLMFNDGQVDGLPRNPRFIRDSRFGRLKKSLLDDPEMLYLRELLVFPVGNKFVVIGGNMRLRAATELGFTELPCKVLPDDTPVEKLRAYTIKDNISFGEDDDDLMTEWNEIELEDFGFDFGVETDFNGPRKATDRSAVSESGDQEPSSSPTSHAIELRKIVLYYDTESHESVLKSLQRIGTSYGIVDDISSVVSKLIDFHEINS